MATINVKKVEQVTKAFSSFADDYNKLFNDIFDGKDFDLEHDGYLQLISEIQEIGSQFNNVVNNKQYIKTQKIINFNTTLGSIVDIHIKAAIDQIEMYPINATTS